MITVVIEVETLYFPQQTEVVLLENDSIVYSFIPNYVGIDTIYNSPELRIKANTNYAVGVKKNNVIDQRDNFNTHDISRNTRFIRSIGTISTCLH